MTPKHTTTFRKLIAAAATGACVLSLPAIGAADSAPPHPTAMSRDEALVAATCEILYSDRPNPVPACAEAVRYLSRRFGPALLGELRETRNGASWTATIVMAVDRMGHQSAKAP